MSRDAASDTFSPAFSATAPLNAGLAWVTVWNRKLSAVEAAADAVDPEAITSGMIHQVRLCPDDDVVGGFDMSVVGILPCLDAEARWMTAAVSLMRSPIRAVSAGVRA